MMDWLISINFQMWFVFIMTGWASYSFIREKLPIEVTSVILLTMLLLFGQVFPVLDANGNNLLNSMTLLAGFANPALVAVLGLLVMGQAIVQTDALRPITQIFLRADPKWAWVSMFGILFMVMALSAFMNNTPLVILAIPILQALTNAVSVSESRIMIPLSFAAILGGMTTLVGSSTNMLVSGAMVDLGYNGFGFFDFVVPGSVMASIGFLYVLFVLPRMMPDRRSFRDELVGEEKEFIAELDVSKGSKLIGQECVNGTFPSLETMKIRLIQRSGHLVLPPFEGYVIQEGDILIVATTRDSLGALLTQHPGFLLSEEEEKVILRRKDKQEELFAEEDEEDADLGASPTADLEEKVADTRMLAEIMITPASRLIDMSIDHAGFHRQFGAVVLGIQRRARVVRRRLGRIRLEAGDVLLVAGSKADIEDMRYSQDLIVLSGSKKELPVPKKAPIAGFIMMATIGLAAFGILSIPVAAITGSVLMIATDCLNVRQATRAIDRKIFLLVGAMLALGQALQVTRGDEFIADSLLSISFVDTPFLMLSLLFIVVAICTNILSNNACAILFTPIAAGIAVNMGVDPFIFALTVLFASNCSFASPIGYKTNLLVMGPGNYRFRDFIKGGVPLIFILWFVFMGLLKFYFAV
ncbi:MAG: SLC13 family permease [Alphaproteobacteria bacterium]|jgi:di/tricarboxylate transporter|nr:SLC13 family permease [Alphaproteobacteria bacterium]MDP7222777.1 SLC13 family permease [Alphaproteobacteria bacterium]